MSDPDKPNRFADRAATQGIEKIARLVDGRTSASLEEIARLIKEDDAVAGRLMARAYPRAPAREAATLQMATTRVGINYVIVLYITDLLTQFVLETFRTKLGMDLAKDDPSLMPLEQRGYLVATVRFAGKATGHVSLVLSSTMGLVVADRLLGEGVEMTLENIHTAVAELADALGTSLENGLGQGRLPCRVQKAEVTLENCFPHEAAPGRTIEEFYFRQGTHGVRVHLCLDPLRL